MRFMGAKQLKSFSGILLFVAKLVMWSHLGILESSYEHCLLLC